jgi:hypothetical protein
MRSPRAANTAINGERLRKWVAEYGSYRHAVTNTTIEGWLDQFHRDDRDLAARVLDAVEFYGADRISTGFRQALRSIPGWRQDTRALRGRWRFAAFSGSAGESGDSMLHNFRIANSLDKQKYKEMFVHRSELSRLGLGKDDTIVLIDDMTATGDQVCRAWTEQFEELVHGVGRIYLIVVVAGKQAKARIGTETRISLVPVRQLEDRDGLFSDHCNHFKPADKEKILEYSKIADPEKPKGYGDCAYLLVFHHRCPNNSLPVLHRTHANWEGIFPRHD